MEQMTNEAAGKKSAGGARLKKGGSAPLIALGLTAAIMAGAYAGLCAYAENSPKIWKNTYVLGQDVGGLTPGEAVQKVESALPELEIGLFLYDSADAGEFQDRPGAGRREPDVTVSLEDLGAEADVPALVQGAERTVKSGAFLTAGWRYLSGGERTCYSGANMIRIDGTKAAETAEQISRQCSWPALDTVYELEENALLVRTAMNGRALDEETLRELLEPKYWDTGLTLDVPYETLPPARTLTAQEIHSQVFGEVRNAGYDAETDSIIPEQIGADFDVPGAQAAMDGAEPGETVRIPAAVEFPSVTAVELEALLFRDVLGEARTRVTGTAARISNVKLAASSFNGVVMNAGDVFSYNETVGQRTIAKGYRPAPAYVRGETVDEVGGGVCQPSSTLYLACLRANLEITERFAHRYTPSYIDWGMDATVSWGGPDYKFTNDTGYPIRIVTSYEKGYLTVQILGTNVDGTSVKMTNRVLSTTPFEVVYEDDPTLAPGEERVSVTPYTGHKVESYRNVYDAQGNLLSSSFEALSNYYVRNRVILRGPVDEPAVSTEPEEEPGVPALGSGGDTPVIILPPPAGDPEPLQPPDEEVFGEEPADQGWIVLPE